MQTRLELATEQTRTLAMTSRLRQAIGLLRLGNQQLSDHLASLAEANPHLALTPAPRSGQARNWLDQFLSAPPAGAARGVDPVPWGGAAAPTGDAAERAVAPAPGLVQHVRAQLGLLLKEPADAELAEAFLEALEPSGWLGSDLADIAGGCGCTLAQAERVLARLQQAEPAGLFARSLAECLRLQAADQGLLAPDFALLLDNLPLLARGDEAALARRCGCTPARLDQMLRSLRAMNPKPGAAFGDAPAPITEPDLIVRRAGAGWTVELNRSTLPAIEVREAPGVGADLLRDARFLQRAVARRNATTLGIARAVMLRQQGFLAQGAAALVPLSPAEVAEATGLHPSTISRVTAGLMVATPRATLRLRDFFSAALAAKGQGAPVATQRVLHEMRALIAAEDRAQPLSDDAIAAHFQAQGVVLARRTVAKYRARLGIAASAQRRRR